MFRNVLFCARGIHNKPFLAKNILRYRMLSLPLPFHVPVLDPGEDDDDYVEDGQRDQPERMTEGIAVDLIGDEHEKKNDGGRIYPEPVSPERCDDGRLDDPVGKQVERAQELCPARKMS